MILHCPLNVSEGRDPAVLGDLADAAGPVLLDLHADPFHHRAVITLGGPPDEVRDAARAVAARAIELIDLSSHHGVHPRLGAVDVVPFVALHAAAGPLRDGDPAPAVAARADVARWLGLTLGVPCFLYGWPAPGTADRLPTLPEIRRRAFDSLAPDLGPARSHPQAGASAVGARPALVAYNLFVAGGDLGLARAAAAAVRGPGVRALGFDVGGRPQISANLTEPFRVGPADFYEAVAARLEAAGAGVAGAELVGLVPGAVLEAVPAHRRPELGLAGDPSVEARLEAAGISWR